MPNITLSIDEDLLKHGRLYAKKQHKSLNNLIRELLDKTIYRESHFWLDECFSRMDEAAIDSKGKKVMREELYDV